MLLSHLQVVRKANICKVVSMLFSQRYSNAYEQTQLSFATKYKSWKNIDLWRFNQRNSFSVVSTLFYRRWIDVILSKLFQRYYANVETTSINVRRLNFHFQPNINVETTLMNVDDQCCFNVESTLICLW